MALAIRSAISFLSVSAVAGMISLGCGGGNNDDEGTTATGGRAATGGAKATGGASSVATGGTKATTGGTKATTGGTKATTGGTKATGGNSALPTGGTKATGGVSGAVGGTSAAIGGTSAAVGGTSSAIGGTSAALGGTSAVGGGSSGVGGGSATVGGSSAAGGTSGALGGTSAVGGTAAGGNTSTLPACSTSAQSIQVCLPPDTVNPGNTGTAAERDEVNDPYIGDYQYHVFNGVIQLYGNVAATGRFWQGSPYTDTTCAGRGVDATGKSGLRVTVKNSATNPMTLVLYVTDQAGTASPYTIVPLTKEVEVAAGGPSAQNVSIDVPFSQFEPTCSTSVAFNAATIRQLGLGFGSTGTLDLTISSFSFY
jgi:hypothetical protein